MADRREYRPQSELERVLSELGGQVAFPPTPDVASHVRRRLELAPPVRSLGPHGWARTLALATAAALILIFAALALVPGVRTAVADRLGLPGISITHLPWVPTPTPTATPVPPPLPTPTPVPVGTRLQLGQPVTLDRAQARVPYRILTPALPDLGQPDEVYLGTPDGGAVTLVYRPRPGVPENRTTGVGLLLTELRGTVSGGLLGKGLGPETRLLPVTVGGHLGYWIEGAPHLFYYQDDAGAIQQETLRLASNTLIWEQASLTLRIEAALGKDAALRIAESVR